MLVIGEKCSGCGACYVVCPTGSIIMRQDKEGFFYPVVDEKSCINCGKCEKTCPILLNENIATNPFAYAVKNKSIDKRITSSSGGVFCELANFVLEQNGFVCGAVYDSEFKVHHIVSEDFYQVEKMKGAKYVQSKSWQCFSVLRTYLENGKWVLFVGTPCQVAGFRSFLKKDYEKLILVDMICHGVPSEEVWGKYLVQRTELDTKVGKLYNVDLRNKKTGWSKYAYSVDMKYTDNSSYSVPQNEDWYIRGFIQNLFLRKSCAQCAFKGIHRISDITIGDYWGIWNQHPEFDDNQGISLVLLHSEKSTKIWRCIQKNFDYIDVNVDDAIQENPSAICNSISHEKRNEFFEKLNDTNDVLDLIQQCLGPIAIKKDSIVKKIFSRFFVVNEE